MPGLAGNCPENTLKKPHKRKEITGDTGKAPRPVAFRTLRAEIMVTTMGVELDGKTAGEGRWAIMEKQSRRREKLIPFWTGRGIFR